MYFLLYGNNSLVRLALFSNAHNLLLILLARLSKSIMSSLVFGGAGVGTNFRFLLSIRISESERLYFDRCFM